MEINDLGDLDLRPGRLTLWRISVPGTARWRPDPRRPSYVQEEHLRCFENGRPTWLGVTFEWSGEVDTTALSSAILGWVDRHEALRCRFDRDGTAIHLATVGPGAAALDLVELGDYADPGELARTLEDVFDTKTEPLSWPPHVFVTISRPGCTTLVIASDHSVTDAYSMASVPYEIRELYSAAIQGVAPRLAPAHSYLEYAVSERARVSDLTDGDPVIGHWRELIAATGGQLPDFPVSVGALGGAAALQQTRRIWLSDAESAVRFDRACRAQGGHTMAGMFACLALAGKALGNQKKFRSVAPFHTRNATRWKNSVGWYVGMSPVSFPVSDTFPDLLRSVGLELKRAKETAQVPFSKAMEVLGAALRDRFMVSYMDDRVVPGSDCWARWRTRFLISRSNDPQEVYVWVSRSHDGICLNFRHPGTPTARSAVDRYFAEVTKLANGISGALPRPVVVDD
ncbi:condensation domain-containing protein [Bradyrhizobium sp. CCGUVB4N]|uniref:condensation domain-containing protein n=1 Tax=Bradyrhizobium sp. CCGUVB4N TaxID=2949631 RepID=UPI0020B33751|nr:condensation domain-containing protein [Bradyrhizobium sp. CCGUVB4N]MCP3380092.1 condensation domain-containing protein [Bradyrhizobium sp. CCGUVB4N]